MHFVNNKIILILMYLSLILFNEITKIKLWANYEKHYFYIIIDKDMFFKI